MKRGAIRFLSGKKALKQRELDFLSPLLDHLIPDNQNFSQNFDSKQSQKLPQKFADVDEEQRTSEHRR